MKPILQYDGSKEEIIERFICQIDKKPIINTDHLEETSYLGIPYTSPDNVYDHLRDTINEYKDYIKGFVQSNLGSQESYKHLESTLTWLLTKYQNARIQFVELPLRKEWHTLWHGYKIQNPNNDAKIEQEEKNTKEAYRFFYLVSKFQLNFLEDLISFISGQLLPIKKTNQEISPIQSASQIKESKTVYFFKITKPYPIEWLILYLPPKSSDLYSLQS